MKTDQIIQSVTTSIIAVVSVLGTFSIAFYQLVNGREINVPDIIALLIGAVVGLYFGHSSATNGARQAGAAAAQTAIAASKENASAGSTTPNP